MTPGRTLLWGLSAVAVFAHLLALYLPGSPDSQFDLPGADKVVHVLLFAVPVWLLGRLTGRVWLVAGFFAAHALVSELVQHWFVPHRSGDPLDLLADLVGIALAVWVLSRQDVPGER
ncbi:MAG: VanZ family protein [Propionicimonas sp.]